jgi:hypothetical protein
MENKLKEIIRNLVKEIQSEEELEEMNVTGNVAGYNTPAAFSKPGQTGKKNNRLAKVTGGTIVNDLEEGKLKEEMGVLDLKPEKAKPTATPTKDENDKDETMADVSSMELVENRWLALKKEDATPQKKIAVGLRSVKSQLSEIEKFVNWYSRLKTENNLDRTGYYKRTYSNLNTIKERLNKIAEKIHSM